MALTKENVMKLLQFIMFDLSDIMSHNISDVYDLFTSFYDGNTAYTEVSIRKNLDSAILHLERALAFHQEMFGRGNKNN